MPQTEMNDNTPAVKTDLRDKVDAAKARLAERTGNARPVETVKSLIVEHPVASLAAGILLGALIAKALPAWQLSQESSRLITPPKLPKLAAKACTKSKKPEASWRMSAATSVAGLPKPAVMRGAKQTIWPTSPAQQQLKPEKSPSAK